MIIVSSKVSLKILKVSRLATAVVNASREAFSERPVYLLALATVSYSTFFLDIPLIFQVAREFG